MPLLLANFVCLFLALSVYVFCLHACLCTKYMMVLSKVKRGHQNWSYRGLGATMWALGHRGPRFYVNTSLNTKSSLQHLVPKFLSQGSNQVSCEAEKCEPGSISGDKKSPSN